MLIANGDGSLSDYTAFSTFGSRELAGNLHRQSVRHSKPVYALSVSGSSISVGRVQAGGLLRSWILLSAVSLTVSPNGTGVWDGGLEKNNCCYKFPPSEDVLSQHVEGDCPFPIRAQISVFSDNSFWILHLLWADQQLLLTPGLEAKKLAWQWEGRVQMKGMGRLLPYLLIQCCICYPEITGSWLLSRGEAYPQLFQPHFSTSCLLCLEGAG